MIAFFSKIYYLVDFIKILIIAVIVLMLLAFKKEAADYYHWPQKSSSGTVEAIVSEMTLEEKIGQMTLVEKNSIKKGDIARKNIGAILSGGGGGPTDNSPQGWHDMIYGFQNEAASSRLKIPLLYGVDAVHGHANVSGAVIFPHSIGLGASRDSDLVYDIARATAVEMKNTGANWNFFPMLSMPKDLRWGRVYECFGDDQSLVSKMGTSYIKGLSAEKILSTPKHFIGEGLEGWGSSFQYKIDQGEVVMSSEELRNVYLPPFKEAINNGALSIMISRSSWNGVKISANKDLLTGLIKNELGFKGFLVSDWGAIDQLSNDDYQNTIQSINAGIDMVMVPTDYDKFMNNLNFAVQSGDVKIERINDAVTRILEVKRAMGLFDKVIAPFDQAKTGGEEHRRLARKAVSESLVLLKNSNNILPIKKDVKKILIVGEAANDIGLQSGGWTINWQGFRGQNYLGTTIYNALNNRFHDREIIYDGMKKNYSGKADLALVVVGEEPYAEGLGDKANISINELDRKKIEFANKHSNKTVLLIIAGRPLILGNTADQVDSIVMAWLPGSEGDGIVDVLSGDKNFKGKLPLGWPRSMRQVESRDFTNPLYPFGFGLDY